MSIVKPPHKFNNPYKTYDTYGKQRIKYRFGLLDFSDGKFKEWSNTEKMYYKNCTIDLTNLK
jgi:hypothetical protein